MVKRNRRDHVFVAVTVLMLALTQSIRAQNDPCTPPRDPGEPFDETSIAQRDGFWLGERFRVNLLFLKDHPEAIDRYGESMAKRQLGEEKRARAAADDIIQYPSTIERFNSVHPAFSFDWSELKESEAANVYLFREMPWPFVTRDKDWNPHAPLAWVGTFVFPRAMEVDRDPQYAAREALPLLKKQILSVAKYEPLKLWFPIVLTPSDYSFDENTRTLRMKSDLLAPAEAPPSQQGAMGLEYYKLPSTGGSESQWKAGGYRITFDELDTWRSMPDFLGGPKDIALDRQLRVGDLKLPADYVTAASFTESRGFLQLRLFITFRDNPSAEQNTTKGLLQASVEKIEVVDLTGKTIATVQGKTLPAPGKVPLVVRHEFRPAAFGALRADKIRNCRVQREDHERTERHVAALQQLQRKEKADREDERRKRDASLSGANPSNGPGYAQHQPRETGGVHFDVNNIRTNIVRVFRILEPSEVQKGPVRPEGSAEQGTGILLDNQQGTLQVLTANHVVTRADSSDVEAPSSANAPLFISLGSDKTTEVPAQVVCRNQDADIAVVVAKVPLDLQRFIPKTALAWIPRKSLAPGQVVWLIDGDGKLAKDTLINLVGEGESNSQGKDIFYTSNMVADGFSGGPVLSDQGALIAVHVETQPGKVKTGLGTSIDNAMEVFNTQCFRSVRTGLVVEKSK